MGKLLIDNNLSVLLKETLAPHFPGTKHVSGLQLTSAADTLIWKIASEQGYTILTKDKDFYHRVTLTGAPPKVIWITRGNCRNREMIQIIQDQIENIKSFILSDQELMIIE